MNWVKEKRDKDKSAFLCLGPLIGFIAKAFLVNLSCELRAQWSLRAPAPATDTRHGTAAEDRVAHQKYFVPSSQWEPEPGQSDQSQASIAADRFPVSEVTRQSMA